MNEQENIPLLDDDLSSVDTSRPLLAEGIYNLRVAELSIKESEGTGNKYINARYELDQDAQSVAGEAISPGFSVFDIIVVSETEKMDADSIRKRLALLQEAWLGKKTDRFAPLEQYVGASFQAVIGIETDKGGKYDDKNRVKKYIPKSKQSDSGTSNADSSTVTL